MGGNKKYVQYVALSLLASSLVTFAPFLGTGSKAQSAAAQSTISTDSTQNPISEMANIETHPKVEQTQQRYSVYQTKDKQQLLLHSFQNLNDAINFAKGMANTEVIDQVSHNVLWNNTLPNGNTSIKDYVRPPRPGANPSFDNALAFVLDWEGGYSNQPDDHGGPTFRGITQREYDFYRTSKGVFTQDVKNLSNDELREIYYNGYWLPVHGNDLPYPLALAMFDSGVNCGPGTAVNFLQSSLGTAQDGVFGSEVVNALAHMASPAEIALQIADYRDQYYQKIVANDSTQAIFLQGWLNRDNALTNQLSQWILQNHLYFDEAKWYMKKGNVYNAAYYADQAVKMGSVGAADAVSLGDSLAENDRMAFYQDLTSSVDDTTGNIKQEVNSRLLNLAKSYLTQNDFVHAVAYSMRAFQFGATPQAVVGIADSFTKDVQTKYWNAFVQSGQDLPPAIDAEFMKRQSISVTGVNLDETNLSLVLGSGSKKLNAVVAPANSTDHNVTWSTDNSNVVTVDGNGNITPVAAGTARVTVQTEDGGKTATCVITVMPQSIPVSGISLDNNTINLSLGGRVQKQLHCFLSPANVTNTIVTWSSDHENVVKVDANGVLTPVGVGTATVTATSADGGKKANCTITVVQANDSSTSAK